jgi:transcription antitermination factor NusG
VAYLLTSGDRPAVVRDEVISEFQALEDSEGFVVFPEQTIEPQLQKGQNVRLRKGPFLGYIGLYDGQSAADRERVLLTLLGRDTVIYVSRDDIEAQRA